jgi:hypothetical protein
MTYIYNSVLIDCRSELTDMQKQCIFCEPSNQSATTNGGQDPHPTPPAARPMPRSPTA